MCLIAFHWDPNSPTRTLLLASNRDENYDRKSQTAHYWPDMPHIYGGRDLLLGGTWLACSTSGRLAAITNFHSKADRGKRYPKSRGEILTSFLNSGLSAMEFAADVLESVKGEFGGFCVLLFDGKRLICCSNRDKNGDFARELPGGIYGLSNNLLDIPWPKMQKVKATMAKVVEIHPRNKNDGWSSYEAMTKILLDDFLDTARVSDRSLLPRTLGLEEEHIRSSVFVCGPSFGTRTTTIISYHRKGDGRRSGKCGFDVTEKNHKTPGDMGSPITREFVKRSTV